jgi:hypothetical protein
MRVHQLSMSHGLPGSLQNGVTCEREMLPLEREVAAPLRIVAALLQHYKERLCLVGG